MGLEGDVKHPCVAFWYNWNTGGLPVSSTSASSNDLAVWHHSLFKN